MCSSLRAFPVILSGAQRSRRVWQEQRYYHPDYQILRYAQNDNVGARNDKVGVRNGSDNAGRARTGREQGEIREWLVTTRLTHSALPESSLEPL